LDVDIETWNSELELIRPNAGCLDGEEFGIGNQAQYQSAFTTLSPRYLQYGVQTFYIRCNRPPSSHVPASRSLGRRTPLDCRWRAAPPPHPRLPPRSSRATALPCLPPPASRTASPLPSTHHLPLPHFFRRQDASSLSIHRRDALPPISLRGLDAPLSSFPSPLPSSSTA
jgi:hypothetical protein